jgi:hypothetical protein
LRIGKRLFRSVSGPSLWVRVSVLVGLRLAGANICARGVSGKSLARAKAD